VDRILKSSRYYLFFKFYRNHYSLIIIIYYFLIILVVNFRRKSGQFSSGKNINLQLTFFLLASLTISFHGTYRVSQVPVCFSLYMLNLRTTVDPEYSRFTIIQVLASDPLISLPSTYIAIFEAKLVLGSTVFLTACIIPCVRFKYFVRSFFKMNSATPATLDIGGLLILA
jgi:hypothetical protein